MKENFSNWFSLLLHYFKRDWKKIILWILGLGLFSGAYVPAFEEISKGSALQGLFETLQNPAMIAMVGPTPVTSAAEYTLGAMYANEMLLFCGLFAMIVSALHVNSHTRKEEELGLTELIRSFRVGRHANSLAVIKEVAIVNLLLGLFISTIMISFNATTITSEGAILFACSIAGAGILGSVLALTMAQIMPSASGASGATLSIIGLLYILRATTDISNLDLSMFNPMGWIYLTYPFTTNNWMPLVYSFVFSMILMLLAFVLETHRDMGAGYLPEPDGRATAPKGLLSIPGLFFRINRNIMISWMIGFIIMGAAYGSIFGDMQTFIESNDIIKHMFTSTGVSLEASFTATLMVVLVGLVGILPISIINKLFSEEIHGRLSQIFATRISRATLYWSNIILAILAGTIGIALAAGSLGLSALYTLTKKTLMTMPDFLASGFNLWPTILFFVGLSGFFLGWFPRLGRVAYVYLIYSFMLNYFDGLLNFPKWFLNTSIYSWLPKMPIKDFDLTVFSSLIILSIALIVIGFVGYKKRDMTEGE